MKEPFGRFIEKELGDDFVLIACGLPGTWKTETTEEVARIKDYPLLSSDLIRPEMAIGRILQRMKEDYVSNALTEQAYLNNKKKFDKVDIDDLKKPSSDRSIAHLVVDMRFEPPEDWYITGMEQKQA